MSTKFKVGDKVIGIVTKRTAIVYKILPNGVYGIRYDGTAYHRDEDASYTKEKFLELEHIYNSPLYKALG